MKPIYLEPDEEITSVIEKIQGAGEQSIALVVAKNSTLIQSLINLKLLAKLANERRLELSIITGNKIGQRLCRQVGLSAYPSLGAVSTAPTSAKKEPVSEAKPETGATVEEVNGVPVHQYNPSVPKKTKIEDEQESPISREDAPKTDDELIEKKDEDTQEDAESSTTEAEASESVKIEKEPSSQDQKSSSSIDDLPPIVQRIPSFGPPKERKPLPVKAIVLGCVAVLILLLIGYVLVPSATVVVTMPAENRVAEKKFSVVASPAELENEIIGVIIESERTASTNFPATGRRDIGTRATGNVAIRNCEDTNSRNLANNSRLVANERIFLTTRAISIPAGSFTQGGRVCNSSPVTVPVTAIEPGEAFNLSNANFTVQGQPPTISGTGTTSGGLTRQVAIVSQTDINNALTALRSQVETEVKNELTSLATDRQFFQEAVWELKRQETTSHPVDAQVDSATATVTIKRATLVFNVADVNQALKTALNEMLTDNQTLRFPKGEPTALISFDSLAANNSALIVRARMSGYATTEIDQETVKRRLIHASTKRADEIIKNEFSGLETEITLRPEFWIERLPILPNRIEIKYGFAEVEQQVIKE